MKRTTFLSHTGYLLYDVRLNFTKNQFLKLSFRIRTKDLKQPVSSYLLRLPATSLTSSTSTSPLDHAILVPHLSLCFKTPDVVLLILSFLLPLMECSYRSCGTASLFPHIIHCPPMSPSVSPFLTCIHPLTHTVLPSPLTLLYFSHMPLSISQSTVCHNQNVKFCKGRLIHCRISISKNSIQ